MTIPARPGVPLPHRDRVGCACSLLLGLIISAIPGFPQAAPRDLVLDSLNVRQEGVVSFSTLFLGTDTRSDFAAAHFLVGQTENEAFRLYVDVESIEQVRFNAFTLTAYLANQRPPSSTVDKFQITGNPTGSFQDTPVRLTFHVKAGPASSTGTILMPVYNATKSDLLQVARQDHPIYVSVSGATQMEFQLSNPVDSLPVSITDVAVTGNCSKCWNQLSSSVAQKSSLQIAPGTNASLPLALSPNSVPALLQGALLLRPEAPHDTLSIALTYHTVPGGAEKKQTILANVRFGPGLFGLALALCGGIALGLAARYLLTNRLGNENERALHAVLSALVLCLIVECVGILLTSYGDSKLVVFGMDVDPRQLFPAFILAILVSGGSAVVSSITSIFGKAK